jgi:hypothetical protein
LEVHSDAAIEAQEAAAWYEDKREGLGFDFLWEVAAAFRVLRENIMHGKPWPDPPLAARGVKQISLKEFPYQVAFIESPSKAIVLAVAHVRRRPGYWQDRLK